jgi:hypothetical protein
MGTPEIVGPNVAVNKAVDVDSEVDVSMRLVKVAVGVEPVMADVGIGMADVDKVVLLLCEFFHGTRRHCSMRAVSTSWPFWFEGVMLRT